MVTIIERNKIFRFLDQLRESGTTNMLMVRPIIERKFELFTREAQNVHVEWMSTFSDRHPELETT